MEIFDKDSVAKERRPGRAAGGNPAIRFERFERVDTDDGWGSASDDGQPPLRTEVAFETPRSVITRNASPDLFFDRSINPYRGCEHGCIYCFARPSHAYLGLSPGLDFETRLIARPEAPAVLEKELRRRGYKPRTIAIGTNTDPYQPIEKEHRIMRGVLKVLRDFNHPVGVVTKGALIERDIDILRELAARGLTRVGISLTTLSRDVARVMEPRVPAPGRRLRTIERLAEAGIEVRAMVSPVVPGLTDHEVESILRAAADAGAKAASWIVLRLPREVEPLFRDWLKEHFPDRAARVMARVTEMHGGQVYDAAWGKRQTGQGVAAELLAQRFKVTTARLGLMRDLPPLRTDLFAPPPRAGDQLALF